MSASKDEQEMNTHLCSSTRTDALVGLLVQDIIVDAHVLSSPFNRPDLSRSKSPRSCYAQKNLEYLYGIDAIARGVEKDIHKSSNPQSVRRWLCGISHNLGVGNSLNFPA